MKNTIKILFIILFILPVNATLTRDNVADAQMLTNIIDPPNTAALNIMVAALSSLKELRKQNQGTPENIEALIKIKLLPNIAIDIVTNLVLKDYWNTIDSKQKQILQQYIIQSLIADYADILGAYEQIGNINISTDPNVKRRDNRAIVKLLISLSDGQNPFAVTLKMTHSNRWRIYDILFSGVSIIKNYKAQFNSIIKRKGLDNFIKEINKKLTKSTDV
ncbi:MAG: ABC transporter substrate-binding protein [Candidatus Thioglobus sp.]|nr:MAG: ABC transporter substrate-binding protein [Candidatus Thioglobus sp.]KAA0448651.1 MAG: ABC transporter substrate-binding protein [Candidatus Thioglobus sp.]